MNKIHRNIISCGVLLVLAAAVLHKNREVAGLKAQASQLASREQIHSFAATKAHDQRPAEVLEESLDDEFGEIDASDPLAGTSTFAGKGDLSPEVIRLLGLKDDEVRAVNEAIGRFRTEARQDLAKRLKPTVKHSEDGSLHQLYYARARRDRGQAYVDSLSLEFGAIIGQDRSRQLIKGFTRDDLAARLGRLDLELEMVRSEKGIVKLSHQFRSPRTGDITEFGQSDLAEFEARFGELFEDSEEQ